MLEEDIGNGSTIWVLKVPVVSIWLHTLQQCTVQALATQAAQAEKVVAKGS